MFKKTSLILAAVFGLGAASSVRADDAAQQQFIQQHQAEIQNALKQYNSQTDAQKKQFLQQHQAQIQKALGAVNAGKVPAQVPAKAPVVQGSGKPQAASAPAVASPPVVPAVNPLGGFGADGSVIDPSAIGGMADNINKLQALMANPWVQRYMKLYQDPKFMAARDRLMKNENRMNLLYAEFGLMFLIFMLRTWRSTKVKGFMGALWLRMWTFLVFAMMSVIVLPSYLLGDSYAECVNMIFKAFTTKI